MKISQSEGLNTEISDEAHALDDKEELYGKKEI